jgi:hypothetical protein
MLNSYSQGKLKYCVIIIRSWKLNYRSNKGDSSGLAQLCGGSACRERWEAVFELFISSMCGIDCECSQVICNTNSKK